MLNYVQPRTMLAMETPKDYANEHQIRDAVTAHASGLLPILSNTKSNISMNRTAT